MHAFSRQVRTHTPWGNGRPTFYNIELVEILNRDANAKMVFHYNANNGRDVWYNSHHYTNCATPAMERYPKFCIGFKIRKSRSEQLLLSGSGHSK